MQSHFVIDPDAAACVISVKFKDPIDVTKQHGNNPLVRKFISLVEQHYKEIKSVREYAAKLFVSPSYLNSVVKTNSGCSASYHIRGRIVREAKRQAMFGEMNMKEIAYYLGFCNSAHFSKFFKNIAGRTFSDYKQSAGHYF